MELELGGVMGSGCLSATSMMLYHRDYVCDSGAANCKHSPSAHDVGHCTACGTKLSTSKVAVKPTTVLVQIFSRASGRRR